MSAARSQGLLSLGQMARQCGLARSSLLHYEALGLLLPTGRSLAGYRLYGAAEVERLRVIRRYREAGLSLAEIGDLLGRRAAADAGNGNGNGNGDGDGDGDEAARLLEQRLFALCREIESRKAQQKKLAKLLAAPEFRGRAGAGKAAWVALLQRAGFTEQDRLDWHRYYEADSPGEHAAFLRSLGLSEAEVEAIREWSRPAAARA